MAALLSKLFPARRTRPARRRPAAPARARLGVEGLEGRDVPSITSGLYYGSLVVQGDGSDDVVGVNQTADGRLLVSDYAAGRTFGYNAADVTDITVYGFGGRDWVVNGTAKPSILTGGDGDDYLMGGGGNDYLYGGDGADRMFGSGGADWYIGGAGRDTLTRLGYHGYFQDGNAADGDLTVGSVAGRLTPAELGAVGGLTASREPSPNRVTLNGPSGAGFGLLADWRTDAAGYVTTGPVTLETRFGKVTLPAAGATRVAVSGWSPAGDAGTFAGITWNSLPVTGTNNPLNGVLDAATNGAGLDVDLPGVDWGVKLGRDIRTLDGKAPLNDAVPYLFARTSGGFSLKYESVKVESPQAVSAAFAFSPGDGTVYATVGGLPLVGDIGVAVSPTGVIPYRPDRLPDLVDAPAIYGHAYIRGAVSLTDAGIPIGIRGETLVDLDANDDGAVAGGLTRAAVAGAVGRFARGLAGGADGLADLGRSTMADVAVGVNGGLDLKLKALTVEMGTASGWYKPGQIAFRAASTSPFAKDATLKTIMGGGSYDLQGYLNGAGTARTWHFRADVANSGLFGLSASGLYVEAGSAVLGDGAVRAGAWVPGPLGSTLRVEGVIGFNGYVYLSGSAASSKSVKSGTFRASVDVNASLTLLRFGGGAVTISAAVGVSAAASVGGLGQLGAAFTAYMGVSVDGSGRPHFTASGDAGGWYAPVVGGKVNVSLGFSMNDRSLTLVLPYLPDPTFTW